MSDARIERVRAFISARIDECRRVELKFKPYTDASVTAVAERMALQRVLSILNEAQQGGES